MLVVTPMRHPSMSPGRRAQVARVDAPAERRRIEQHEGDQHDREDEDPDEHFYYAPLVGIVR